MLHEQALQREHRLAYRRPAQSRTGRHLWATTTHSTHTQETEVNQAVTNDSEAQRDRHGTISAPARIPMHVPKPCTAHGTQQSDTWQHNMAAAQLQAGPKGHWPAEAEHAGARPCGPWARSAHRGWLQPLSCCVPPGMPKPERCEALLDATQLEPRCLTTCYSSIAHSAGSAQTCTLHASQPTSTAAGSRPWGPLHRHTREPSCACPGRRGPCKPRARQANATRQPATCCTTRHGDPHPCSTSCPQLLRSKHLAHNKPAGTHTTRHSL